MAPGSRPVLSLILFLNLILILFLVPILSPSAARAFETNGRHWPSTPVDVWVNPEGAPDFGPGVTPESVVEAAFAAWSAPACTTAAFRLAGTTTDTWAADGKNVIFWVPAGWVFGESAAGATLWQPAGPGDPMEVDLALNAEQFQWVPGGGDALHADIVDPVSVVTHELGHWLGLAHSPHPFATMFQALMPNGVQATLDGDDRAGICTLYPSGAPDCATDADCGDGRACRVVADVLVCDEVHDPIGAQCTRTHLDCDGLCTLSFFECATVCWPLAADYSDGYCAPLCGTPDGGEVACPAGWKCGPVPGQDAKVCTLDPDAEPAPEAAEDVAEDTGTDPGQGLDQGLEPDPGLEPGPDAGTEGAPETGEPDDAFVPAEVAADSAPGTPDASRGGGSGCAMSAGAAGPGSSAWSLALAAIVLASLGRFVPRSSRSRGRAPLPPHHIESIDLSVNLE